MCSPILEDIDISEAAKALWEAPFAVLSHDKFESEDPQFTYANKVSFPCCCTVNTPQISGLKSRQCRGRPTDYAFSRAP